jgi:hypothetical protein
MREMGEFTELLIFRTLGLPDTKMNIGKMTVQSVSQKIRGTIAIPMKF